MVFLAAGTLGTTRLLLRSEREGLALSERLGHGFSTNGDFGAFVVGTAHPVYSARGPVNTCHLKATVDGTHLTVEDCAIPSMFAAIASVGLNVLDSAVKRRLFHTKLRFAWLTHSIPDLRDFLPHLPDTYDPSDARTEAETVANIFFFNAMGQDDASGRFTLDDDELDLKWDTPIAKHPTFTKVDELCKQLAKEMGGDYVALWDALPRRKLTIPHPLGGCPIGATREQGVVDEHGAVFDGAGAGPTDTHPGLFVVDGSTIPGALAVNPTLTITAQALKSLAKALP
jgi:cholesterol oxidase